jgi:hypothetical protein
MIRSQARTKRPVGRKYGASGDKPGQEGTYPSSRPKNILPRNQRSRFLALRPGPETGGLDPFSALPVAKHGHPEELLNYCRFPHKSSPFTLRRTPSVAHNLADLQSQIHTTCVHSLLKVPCVPQRLTPNVHAESILMLLVKTTKFTGKRIIPSVLGKSGFHSPCRILPSCMQPCSARA